MGLDSYWIIKYPTLSKSTGTHLNYYTIIFITAPMLWLHNQYEAHSIWISPAAAGTGSPLSLSVLSGVFTD
jgi:hypothetical protein